jgi:hypothetical protein
MQRAVRAGFAEHRDPYRGMADRHVAALPAADPNSAHDSAGLGVDPGQRRCAQDPDRVLAGCDGGRRPGNLDPGHDRRPLVGGP